MKNPVKKTSVMLLSMALALSMLAGCSTPKEDTSTGSKGESTKQDTGKTEEKKIHKMKILCSETQATTFTTLTDREQYPVWDKFAEFSKGKGVEFDFEIIPKDQFQVIIQTRMAAANKLPDIAEIGALDTTTLLKLGKQGIIQPINDIIENYSDGTAKTFYGSGGTGEFSKKLNTAPDGNLYWYSMVGSSTYEGKPKASSIALLIRKDWLEKLELSAPTTTEEFLTTMKTFRDKDANGNKQVDEIAVLDISGFTNGVAQAFGLVNGNIGLNYDTNKAVSPWQQEGIKDYFKYMNQLYKDGIIDPAAKEDQSNAANIMGAVHNFAIQTWLEPATGVKDAGYLPLLPLKAVDSITPLQIQGTPTSSFAWSRYAFTKNCTDKEGMGAVLDILTSKEYKELSEWGIEGVHYERDGDGYKSLIGTKSWEDLSKEKNPIGYQVWGFSGFPRMGWGRDWTSDLEPGGPNADYKANYQKEALKLSDSGNVVYSDIGSYLAMPTEEQLEAIGKISADLNTYSAELATKLVIGESSLDDWDKYMAELKELKLDELIAINQDQHDRFLNS